MKSHTAAKLNSATSNHNSPATSKTAPRSWTRRELPRNRRQPAWAITPEQLNAWEIHQADRAETRRARQTTADAASVGCTDEQRRFWIAHRAGVLKLGRSMPQESGRQAFADAGCIATILAVIASSKLTRNEIVHRTQERSRYSYRQIGFLLGQLTGSNRNRHLWEKDANGIYRLHPVTRRPATIA